MQPSINYFGNSYQQIHISVDLVCAYHSIVGPSYLNDFEAYLNKPTAENSFLGFMHCISGEGVIDTINGSLDIKANDFVFIKHHDIVRLRNSENCRWEFFCVWFNQTGLELNFNNVFNFEITKDENDSILRMITLLQNKDYVDTCLANSICQLLLCKFMKQTSDSLNLEQDKKMQDIAFYIHKNINRNISTSELAQRCAFCNNQFRNVFKKTFQCLPKQYILKVKLERAAFLLMHTNETIANISYELSFYSPSHFVSCFKNHYRMTPTEYRIASK